jgi:hypothetical protein
MQVERTPLTQAKKINTDIARTPLGYDEVGLVELGTKIF